MFLQRALRVNGASSQLWLAYFKLECLYVLRVRARRMVLGLPEDTSADGQAAHRAAFMAGAVPQVVFDRAVEAIPHDASFRGQFLQQLQALAQAMVEEAGEEAARAAQAAETEEDAPPPAVVRGLLFPALHRHILLSLMQDFPTEPAAWRVVAQAAESAAAPGAPVPPPGQGAEAQQGLDLHGMAVVATAGSAMRGDADLTCPSAVDEAAGTPRRRRKHVSPADHLAAWAAAASAAATPSLSSQHQEAAAAAQAVMHKACAAAPSTGMFAETCRLLHNQRTRGVLSPEKHATAVLSTTAAASAAGMDSGLTQSMRVAVLQSQGQHASALEAAARVAQSGAACASDPQAWLVYADTLEQYASVQDDEGVVPSVADHPCPLAVHLRGAVATGGDISLLTAAVHTGCAAVTLGQVAPGSPLHATVATFSDVSGSLPGRSSAEAVTGVPAACPAHLTAVCQLFLHCLRLCAREDRQQLQLQFATWLHGAEGVEVLLLLVPVVVQGGASSHVFKHLIQLAEQAGQLDSDVVSEGTLALFTAAVREHGEADWHLWRAFVMWLRGSGDLHKASAVYEEAVRTLENATPFVEACQ